MTKSKFYRENLPFIRNKILEAASAADNVKEAEEILIKILYEIDRRRLFVRVGFKSLRSFCHKALNFSKFQSQRLAVQVRRFEPVDKIGTEAQKPEASDS